MSGMTQNQRTFSTAILLGLVVACQPPTAEENRVAEECLGDDCLTNAQVHGLGGEDDIVTGEINPTSVTMTVALTNYGPDASDSGIYGQVTKIPLYTVRSNGHAAP